MVDVPPERRPGCRPAPKGEEEGDQGSEEAAVETHAGGARKVGREIGQEEEPTAVQKRKNATTMLEAARHKANVEEKEAIVNKMHAILMLGGSFSAAPVGPASTSSSVARPPQCPLLDVGVIAPSTPRSLAVIDLNVTSGSSSGFRPSVEMQRKQARSPSMATMPPPRVPFHEMPTPTPTVEYPLYN
ncbi:hypothetical protein D1007_10813 [Hordeum vulgare]|nr:hypothetical protein D1007_10813 [Hordeum vulgare]